MQKEFQMEKPAIYPWKISSRKSSAKICCLNGWCLYWKKYSCFYMGLSVYESCTFFYHQSRFLFPLVLKYWENYQAGLFAKIKDLKNAVWSGDGQLDSMGHSAKYGVYTLLCSPIMKIVHFELLQVKTDYIISSEIVLVNTLSNFKQ